MTTKYNHLSPSVFRPETPSLARRTSIGRSHRLGQPDDIGQQERPANR
jgi:hypothetical protein